MPAVAEIVLNYWESAVCALEPTWLCLAEFVKKLFFKCKLILLPALAPLACPERF